MFKKIKIGLITVILVLITLVFANEWLWRIVTFDTGGVNTGELLSGITDTSDVFRIIKTSGGKEIYPETFSFLLWATEGANTDSTNVAYVLHLSNDQTYWHSYGTLGTLTSTQGSSAETTVDDKIFTDSAQFKYGRVLITSSAEVDDTLTCGVQLSLDYSNY